MNKKSSSSSLSKRLAKNAKKCSPPKPRKENDFFTKSLKRAREKGYIPPWTDLSAIQDYYNNRPLRCSVDHIVPYCNIITTYDDGSQGPLYTALHVPWNLQLLPITLNAIKGDSFDGTPLNESWLARVKYSDLDIKDWFVQTIQKNNLEKYTLELSKLYFRQQDYQEASFL